MAQKDELAQRCQELDIQVRNSDIDTAAHTYMHMIEMDVSLQINIMKKRAPRGKIHGNRSWQTCIGEHEDHLVPQ